MFRDILVYFNIRNTLPKSGTFLLGHSVYIYIYIYIKKFSVRQATERLLVNGNWKGFEKKNSWSNSGSVLEFGWKQSWYNSGITLAFF